MVIRFFWTRAASVWIAVLYMVLGLLLLLFPDASGRFFIRALAAGAVLYGVVHLWRYGQSRRTAEDSPGDLFLGVLPLAFADPADYDRLNQTDDLFIGDYADAIASADSLTLQDRTTGATIPLLLHLTERQRHILLAGGLLNYTRNQNNR